MIVKQATSVLRCTAARCVTQRRRHAKRPQERANACPNPSLKQRLLLGSPGGTHGKGGKAILVLLAQFTRHREMPTIRLIIIILQ